jgi:hypothetical protein
MGSIEKLVGEILVLSDESLSLGAYEAILKAPAVASAVTNTYAEILEPECAFLTKAMLTKILPPLTIFVRNAYFMRLMASADLFHAGFTPAPFMHPDTADMLMSILSGEQDRVLMSIVASSTHIRKDVEKLREYADAMLEVYKCYYESCCGEECEDEKECARSAGLTFAGVLADAFQAVAWSVLDKMPDVISEIRGMLKAEAVHFGELAVPYLLRTLRGYAFKRSVKGERWSVRMWRVFYAQPGDEAERDMSEAWRRFSKKGGGDFLIP